MQRLLFLCHANIVRSPAAELLSQARTDLTGVWQFESAGVQALVGRRVDRDMTAALDTYGVDARRRPGSIQAEESSMAAADLILTFESSHRDWVVRHMPQAAKRTLTMRRAEQLLIGRPRRVEVLSMFANDDLGYSERDDFADPVGLGRQAAVDAAAEIARLLGVILPAIGAVR